MPVPAQTRIQTILACCLWLRHATTLRAGKPNQRAANRACRASLRKCLGAHPTQPIAASPHGSSSHALPGKNPPSAGSARLSVKISRTDDRMSSISCPTKVAQKSPAKCKVLHIALFFASNSLIKRCGIWYPKCSRGVHTRDSNCWGIASSTAKELLGRPPQHRSNYPRHTSNPLPSGHISQEAFL